MKKLLLVVIAFIVGSGFLSAQTNGFVHAFDSMHQTFSKYYPMGKWKRIDWAGLNALTRPRIVDAGAAGDTIAFYTALQEYVTSIHDGHTNIRHGWANIRPAAMYRQIGGSYGFAAIGLDDGRIVARLVALGSPAGNAGMEFGAEILEINDSPVHAVLDTIPVLWAEIVPATMESKKLNQYRFLGRAPIGKILKIKFLNRGASLPVTAMLSAVDDNYATYNQTTLTPIEPEPTVRVKVLDGGYGYIKLTSVYGDSIALKNLYIEFRNAINTFISSNAPGLVIDLRVNMGGHDAIAAALSGFFYDATTLYEYQAWYDLEHDSIEIWPLQIEHFNPNTLAFYINPAYPAGTIYVEPQGAHFSKPVMVLVGPRNISSGEGLPMMLKKLPGCKILSFYGSNGSFALVERTHYFFPPPDDFYLRYPYGMSLDQNFIVQLDSDSVMAGGVIPDIRVPLNDTVINQLFIDSIDVEVNYAIKMLNSLLGTENQHVVAGSGLILEQNSPNPFSKSTTISYQLPNDAFVTLGIYDVCGRNLATLVNSKQTTGRYAVRFNAENIKPGVYLYRLSAGNSMITQKCLIE